LRDRNVWRLHRARGRPAHAVLRPADALSKDGGHPVQKVWVQLQVPQCGYCQSGMIMAAAALLAQNKNPSDADIETAMTNLCRCGTYVRVREAIHVAAKSM
jgi:isoquinoline 1-oxidoreductase alpha subunit